jgi:hypothetical protein
MFQIAALLNLGFLSTFVVLVLEKLAIIWFLGTISK